MQRQTDSQTERRSEHDEYSSRFSLFIQTELKVNNSYTGLKFTLMVLYRIMLEQIKSKVKVKQ
jgi:hypothetical protein